MKKQKKKTPWYFWVALFFFTAGLSKVFSGDLIWGTSPEKNIAIIIIVISGLVMLGDTFFRKNEK